MFGFNLLVRAKKFIKELVAGKDFEKTMSLDEYLTLSRQDMLDKGMNAVPTLKTNLESLLLLDRYCKYFAGEFKEASEDKEFQEIEEIFFRGLWMYEAVYVAYSEALALLELDLSKSHHGITTWKVKPECKWRVYKLSKADKQGKYEYTSLISGIPELKIPDEELIEVRWDNNYFWRFLSWWKIAVNMSQFEEAFLRLVNVATKRVAIEGVKSDGEKQIINDAFFDGNPLLTVVGDRDVYGFEGVEFVKIPEIPQFTDSYIQWFYFNAGQMGLTGNVSEKSERMTTGEHVKDLKAVVNCQQVTLKHLSTFADKVKEKWQKELKFELTSMMSMDGSDMQIDNAQTPQGPTNGPQKPQQPKK